MRSVHGVSLWLYNPNGDIYTSFRVYLYFLPSSTSGDHATPNTGNYAQAYETGSLASGEWVNIKFGYTADIVYNISLFFQTNSSATTYVYLGHLSIY